MRTDITKINENTPHEELTEGLMVFNGATSKLFNTGEWRTNTPVFKADLCKQCLLCAPVCPDSSIPVAEGKKGNLIMTTVKDVASVPKYVLLMPLR